MDSQGYGRLRRKIMTVTLFFSLVPLFALGFFIHLQFTKTYHEKILRKLLDRLEIKTRTGQPLEIQHVVLVHPKATITRPPEEKFNTSNVIKADQLPSWYERFIDRDLSMVKVLSLALKYI